MIGEIGVAIADLRPNGKIKVRGEIWNAASTSPVASGERVRIVRVHGLHAEVEPEGRTPSHV